MAHLKQEPLSKDIQNALIECGNRLENASFKDNGDFETIDDPKTLKEATQTYIKLQSGKPKCRLVAWRFSKSTILPIPSNMSVDLIPLKISGSPTVGGKQMKIGDSTHVAQGVAVEPAFVCLVRVYVGPS